MLMPSSNCKVKTWFYLTLLNFIIAQVITGERERPKLRKSNVLMMSNCS